MDVKINSFTIAMLYIGSLLGAGFASGKEIYTYFSIYGTLGLGGIALCTLLFVTLGIILLLYAAMAKPPAYFDLLAPGNERLKTMLEWCMYTVFAVIFMAMLAAGGAVANQQLAIPAPLGSFFTAAAVFIVVARGIKGIVKTMERIVPLILIMALGIAVYLLAVTPANLTGIENQALPTPSYPWPVSALIYLCYNYLAAIPILYVSGAQVKSTQKALIGGALGGLGLGLSAFLLFKVLIMDPSASYLYPMPMLYFAGKLSPALQIAYAMVLILAIFCTATNALYAITPRLPSDNRKKQACLGALCIVCYTLSLIGFTNVIQYVYPLQGVLGFAVIVLLIAGFVKECFRRRSDISN